MTINWIVFACLAMALSSALVAGVFQSFSDFVMRALVATEPSAGIESMQMINRTVFRSVFLVMLLGLAPASLILGAYAYLYLPGSSASWILAGGAVYVVSVFLVTMLGNVPMNNRLDRMGTTSAAAADYWQEYGVVWTRWNHVRTLGALAAAIFFLAAAVSVD
ncbi:DUF1772 domain-containing protein [Parasphingopyxis lamellibrachiae]|uniref:Putative membrane protein n=1 Tax=Parasphingopyxis lamellibrachiae TaxID=680125 RepID=A0A3D9FBM7_9SPHN|nr:anthrone oxygenase family protein [Parasphingopyxis lamellibrachiae]RED15133.1 putative membrane protein [Parasphingopyxis lamellibrachiae]